MDMFDRMTKAVEFAKAMQTMGLNPTVQNVLRDGFTMVTEKFDFWFPDEKPIIEVRAKGVAFDESPSILVLFGEKGPDVSQLLQLAIMVFDAERDAFEEEDDGWSRDLLPGESAMGVDTFEPSQYHREA